MSVDETTTQAPATPPARSSLRHRLYYGETSYDFFGKRWWGIGLSLVAIVISVVSLSFRQLDLSLEFVGGISWDVPAEQLSEDAARQVLDDNGLDGAGARIQELTSDEGRRLKVEVEEQSPEVREAVRDGLAAAAGVDGDRVDIRAVSARWGDTVTESAVRALIVFVVLIVLFITIRFEFAMAIATIAAMAHDVLICVGVYSLFQIEVTPATVIAFLTILGFSLYDGIVVFDKVRENRARYAMSHLREPDIDNISMNQVLMRSLNTNIAAVLPVLALLLADVLFGAESLRDFALALLIGIISGTYSSILIATPLLSMIKTPGTWSPWSSTDHATGDELRALVQGVTPVGRRQSARTRREAAGAIVAEGDAAPTDDTTTEDRQADTASSQDLLRHPPRPRKKKRR